MNMALARMVLAVLAAAMLGVLFGALVLPMGPRHKVKPAPAPSPAVVAPIAADQPVRLNVASFYPTSAPQFGSLATQLADRVILASSGSIDVNLTEPGALVPLNQALDALSTGDLDAVWASPAVWTDRDPAFAFFGAVPFGPRAGELLSWIYYGGGRELQEDLFGQLNIVAIPCGVAAPEAGGWFRNQLRGPEDLKGLRIRFSGLGALVMQRLGAEVQSIPAGDIYRQMEQGNIDATEYSQPALDQRLGLAQLVKNYYFPGWHQQASLIDLLVAKQKWDAMSEAQRAILEMACGDNIRTGLAEGESLQLPALQEFRKQGVEIRKFPPSILTALEAAWQQTVAELSDKNPAFKKAQESFSSFRKDYADWRRLTYVD